MRIKKFILFVTVESVVDNAGEGPKSVFIKGNKREQNFCFAFFFFFLVMVKKICALHVFFLEISFSLIVRPAVLDV